MAIKLSKHHFWRWFVLQNKEYLSLHTKSQQEVRYWTNELSAHLRAYYKFLHFSVWVNNEHTKGVLTISVAGNARYFKYVDRIVALAPSIPGWTIQALDPPGPIDYYWEQGQGHTGIDPHEFWCNIPEDSERPFISVYHPLYTEANQNDFIEAAHAAVYNVLGERTYGYVRDISVHNRSAAGDTELVPLEELPAYLPGGGSSGMMVDAEGKIWEK